MADLSLANLGQGAYPSPPAQSLSNLGADQNGLFGYKIRPKLFDGEDSYFRANPHVSGMAAETNDIILNPHSPQGVNLDAVARNEALRLYMRQNNLTPSFDVTDEQRNMFRGTSYGSNDDALKQTIAGRIYSNDPSAKATELQKSWVNSLIGGFNP